MPRASALLVSDPRQQFSCCLCLHVRTGTIIYGIAQIVIQLIFISFLLLMAFNPRLIPEDTHGKLEKSQPNVRFYIFSALFRLVPAVSDIHESLTLPSPGAQNPDEKKVAISQNLDPDSNFMEDIPGYKDSVFVDANSLPPRLSFETHKQDRAAHEIKIRHFSPYIAICVTAFSLAFCCFMVHGAVTRQPTHLLPFFFIQVFDLIICLIHILGFMSSASDLRLMIHTKTGPVYIKSTSLTFVILAISCVMLAFKAYCLGMVWDCYKYLMLNRRSNVLDDWYSDQWGNLSTFWSLLRAGRTRNNNPAGGNSPPANESNTGGHNEPVTYDPSNDLPKYEDILKIPANAYAPPPYYSSNMNMNNSTATTTDPNGVTARTTAANTAITTTTTTTTTNVNNGNNNVVNTTATDPSATTVIITTTADKNATQTQNASKDTNPSC
uniref:MARVEL domain-containing protein n=1 Tax=Trichobilharzia regenti TaxID=157069 RepID=A0AA85ISU6_TRIRE|nr:unnamed protein product [Trichobilharzia regenti]